MLKDAVQSGLFTLTREEHPSAEDVAKSCNLLFGLTGITAMGNKSMHGSSLGLLPRAD